jgi:hypothetical protein
LKISLKPPKTVTFLNVPNISHGFLSFPMNFAELPSPHIAPRSRRSAHQDPRSRSQRRRPRIGGDTCSDIWVRRNAYRRLEDHPT